MDRARFAHTLIRAVDVVALPSARYGGKTGRGRLALRTWAAVTDKDASTIRKSFRYVRFW